MPKIIIERPYEWYNQKKKIDVNIDNTKVGHVGIDETVQFEVTAGQHTLMLKNQWPARNTIINVDVSDNRDKTIKMKSLKWPFWIVLLSVGFISIVSSLIRSYFNIESFWAVQAPVLAFILIVVMLVAFKKEPLKLEVLN